MSSQNWKSLKPIDEALLEGIDFEAMPGRDLGEFTVRYLVGSFLNDVPKDDQKVQLEEMKAQRDRF